MPLSKEQRKELGLSEERDTSGQIIRPLNDKPTASVAIRQDPIPAMRELEDLIQVFDNSSASVNSASIRAITPRRLYDQIKLEDTGSARRLWIHVTGDDWRKITLS